MQIDLPPVEQVAVVHDSFFREKEDLYWQALLLAAKNQKDDALSLAGSILSDDAIFPYLPWKERVPPTAEDFFDQLFISAVKESPQTLTYLGLLESVGLKAHDAYLDDFSLSKAKARFDETREHLALLNRYQDSADPISLKTFAWELEDTLRGEAFLLHSYPVNQMFGICQDLTSLLTDLHKIETDEDAKNFISRLKAIPRQFEQIITWMDEQKQNGILPPRFALEKSLLGIKRFLEAKENPFYGCFAKGVKQAALSDELLAQAQDAVEQSVIPAYEKLAAYLEDLLPQQRLNQGVWSLPNGDAYYANLLRHHTTTNLTAEEIHNLGLQEVARISAEMAALLGNSDRPVGELMHELASSPEFYFPSTSQGRKECLKGFEEILERSRKELWPLFNLLPQARVVMKQVPEHEEEGSAHAYYCPPSLDGSRSGAFYVNLGYLHDLPKYRMATLAVHEAEPGHHFQCSIQAESTLSPFRRFCHFTAYVEGWALYTEKLAYEQGFYQTNFDRLGHLEDELLRAARLVVDTGIHFKKWSREDAIDYMTRTLGDPSVVEVERYFVMPGQATAYKVGQLKILELRKRAKDQLGDRFDIRDFHDVVLKCGAVPLSVLEEIVDDYIQRTLP